MKIQLKEAQLKDLKDLAQAAEIAKKEADHATAKMNIYAQAILRFNDVINPSKVEITDDGLEYELAETKVE